MRRTRRAAGIGVVAVVSMSGAAAAQCLNQTLFDERPSAAQDFGEGLASDGETLVVGRHASPFFSGIGSVHVYERTGSAWSLSAVVDAPAGSDAWSFGQSVDLSGDTALLGSPMVYTVSEGFLGRVHVLERSAGGWSVIQTLVPNSTEESADFGSSLAICSDRAVVGFGPTSAPDGVVHVFERDQGLWTETAVLAPRDPDVLDFGASVDLEGDRLLVGAEGNSAYVGGRVLSGSSTALVFDWNGTDWVETARLDPSAPVVGSHFGAAVHLAGDRAFVGAPGILTAGNLSGSVFEFTLVDGVWEQTQEILPPLEGAGQGFGRSLSVAGSRLLVGAPGQLFVGEVDATAAYLYGDTESGWEFRARLAPGGGSFSVDAGAAVDLNGETAFASARHAFGSGPSSGVVGVYRLDATLCGAPESISLGAGGTQVFDLNAGAEHAGELFWLIGSASGTSPGTQLGALDIPLEPDGYLRFSVLFPQVLFPGTPASLDEFGAATTAFQLPTGLSATLAGLELHHAALTFDPETLEPAFVTNAVALTVAP